MGKESAIQWTDATWNVARGCTKVDEDCKFCYMYRDSMGSTRYNPLNVVRTKTVFNLPLRLKEPSKIFTSSLTDFFHEAIDSYRNEAWDIIRACPQHTFQILTKRPERINDHLPKDWGEGWDNVWMGTSVGSQKASDRILHLLGVKCKTRFLSIEPMWSAVDLQNIIYEICPPDALMQPIFGNKKIVDCLKGESIHGRIGYNCSKVHWVIIGGESGNEKGKYRYRPCELEWIELLTKQCKTEKVACFVKQLGTHLSKQLGLKDRHGGDMNEWPEHLRIREFPVTHNHSV